MKHINKTETPKKKSDENHPLSIEVKHAGRRPNMSVLALISFACSFAVSRLFTFVNPSAILITSGFHIHHFWFGILMLAIGGWLGISYDETKIDRIAAIFFGAGGGLIGDEVGILLTFRGENYWAGISYTFIIIFLTLASILVLVNKYSSVIAKEFSEFSGSRGGFYLAVFVDVVSLAFLTDTDNHLIIAITGIIAVVAFFTIISFFIQTIKKKLRQKLRRKEPKS